MPFITQGKTNLKYILIVVILVAIVGGGILAYQYYWVSKQEVKITEISTENYCKTDEDCVCGVHKTNKSCFYGNKNYVDTDQQCLDFCTGIFGNLQIRCISNECKQVSIAKDETADWETYRNEKFKIEFKYPDFLPIRYTSVWEPTAPSEKIKSILTLPLMNDSLNVWITTNARGVLPTTTEAEIIEERVINIGGVNTNNKVFKGSEGKTISTVSFERNSVLYSIWAEILGEEENNLNIFNQLLSTFKFLE